MSNAACKFCKKIFGVDSNPFVANPKEGQDVLKRRVPGSKDCKNCHSFCRNEPIYKEMSGTALEEHLQSAANQAEYDRLFGEYCKQRAGGKRRGRGRGLTGCSLLIDVWYCICI